jgi:hypothetical protein
MVSSAPSNSNGFGEHDAIATAIDDSYQAPETIPATGIMRALQVGAAFVHNARGGGEGGTARAAQPGR